ncbi:MAG: biotin/lipoyl-containing protein [Fimbriimonadaceae bacterium]
MKVLLNGVEVDLPSGGKLEVDEGPDRLYVRTPAGTHSALVRRIGEKTWISYQGQQLVVQPQISRARKGPGGGVGAIAAPMPGTVVEVLVGEGDRVLAGDRLLAMEAMKTVQSFAAPFSGTVESIRVQVGQQVAEGDLLAMIAPESE